MAWIGCWNCSASVKDTDEVCSKCGAALKGEARQALENPELLMVATTTPSIEGKRITAYKGIVASEAVIGANLFRGLFASIRDVVGGCAGSYEKVFGRARKQTSLSRWSLANRGTMRYPLRRNCNIGSQ